MPNPGLSDAIKEAYASADTSQPLVETLSVYYEGLVDDSENPTELYIFDGRNATGYRDDGVPTFEAMIEVGAARNAEQLVEFIGVPFEFRLPDTIDDPEVLAQLTIDNVNREMSDLFYEAATSGKSVYLTYRPYLLGSQLDGPEATPPITFVLKNVKAPGSTVTADLTTQTIGNRRFPYETYTAPRFKTLQYG